MEGSGPLPKWQKNVYRCIDGTDIVCRHESVKLDNISHRELPMNGIQSIGKHIFVVVSGTVLKRNMTEVVFGGPARTYALPPTAVIVRPHAFYKNESIVSVRLNKGLKRLERCCFSHSGIRGLVLPVSVR